MLLVPVSVSATLSQDWDEDGGHSSQHGGRGCRRGCKGLFWPWVVGDPNVSLSKRPFRDNRKAHVLPEKVRALKLLNGTHIKIGWVSCRVRKKLVVNRYYHWLGYGHIVVNFQGPDRCVGCWRCGKVLRTVGSCSKKPQCYFCAVW